MCEYCEYSRNIYEIKSELHDSMNTDVYIVNSSIVFDIGCHSYGTAEINFCPMCGRKLSGGKVESSLKVLDSSGWISVKERLPEVGGYVVCIAKRNPFSRFMPMAARIEKNGWVNPITEQYISEVTHWMPLPELPEEADHEN